VLALTICYDVRFPGIYKSLALAGADFITVPSAFTRVTGEAHWHVLLRARAIETGCFILAPAQSGLHECGRETYGASLAVSPWGEVIGEAGSEPGIVIVNIDRRDVDAARRRIPALRHGQRVALKGYDKIAT
jgi:predicted amidohydrolase